MQMAKRLSVVFGAVLFLGMATFGQQAKQETATASSPSTHQLVTFSGKISDDGKTFVSSHDKAVWKIVNPEAFLDNLGARVSIRAAVDALKHELIVTSVQIDPTLGARLHDVAFRR